MRDLIRSSAFFLPLGLIFLASSAFAQEDPLDLPSSDDDSFEFDEERLDGKDDLEKAADDSGDKALDEFEEAEDGPKVDLLGDPEALTGADSADTYRKAEASVAGSEPDEEMQVWEAYLERYPNTSFRTRIERRMTELEDALYKERAGGSSGGGGGADDKQLAFSMPLALENINPRTRAQFGFEYGLPEYMSLIGDYEHGVSRELSVHGGIRRRFTGWNLEAGVRYALVKSARTHTLVTLLGDLRFNFDPAFLGFRPQIAVGKRFGKKLDLMAIGGVELNLRNPFDLRLVGGANATYLAAPTVGLFMETQLHMNNLSWDGGPFTFNTVGVGMKFYPNQKSDRPEALEINVGANVPYANNYWKFHYGSIGVGVNYLFK